MDDFEISKVVDAWILTNQAKENSPEYIENEWAIEQLYEWLREQPRLLWRFIKQAYTRDLSAASRASLAAGPLEDLIVHWGDRFIEEIEQLAKTDERFNYLLGGVWKQGMDDSYWETIVRIRKTDW